MTDWKPFPSTAPDTGEEILVMGYTKPDLPNYRGGDLICITTKWARFESNAYSKQCRLNNDLDEKWITHGFQTIFNLPVVWILWSRIDRPAIELVEQHIASLVQE
jgi:hypothetical protein